MTGYRDVLDPSFLSPLPASGLPPRFGCLRSEAAEGFAALAHEEVDEPSGRRGSGPSGLSMARQAGSLVNLLRHAQVAKRSHLEPERLGHRIQYV